ncbi:hypothetical protein J7K27_06675 [Candidatus Bathyarchaeota archaeon]|nr:hypothetical protein [Candidatus Bathyarchaeota archaeon]
MSSSNKAILIAVNPFKNYIVGPNRISKKLGDVEFHKGHLIRNGGVFWDIVPMGRRDLPWKHPEIHSGYFYISKLKKVKYWISIEYIKRWKEINIQKVEKYIPEPRRTYLKYYRNKCMMYYAILIKEIRNLSPERKLSDFTLASTNTKVKRVQNYAIIIDPGWR